MDTANVYFALLNTGAWPLFGSNYRPSWRNVRRECKPNCEAEDSEFGRFPLICLFTISRGFLCGFDLVDGRAAANTVANRRRIPFLVLQRYGAVLGRGSSAHRSFYEFAMSAIFASPKKVVNRLLNR